MTPILDSDAFLSTAYAAGSVHSNIARCTAISARASMSTLRHTKNTKKYGWRIKHLVLFGFVRAAQPEIIIFDDNNFLEVTPKRSSPINSWARKMY